MAATAPTQEQIAAALALLDAVDSRRGRGQDTPSVALSENRTATDDGTSEQEHPMCKVYGPFKDKNRDKYRVKVIDTLTHRQTNFTFDTEAAARAAIPRLSRQYRRPVGVLVEMALGEYRRHLEVRGNVPGRPNRPRTVAVTMDRLEKVFGPVRGTLTGELTRESVARIWDLRARDLPAVDTRLNTIAQMKTFVAWLTKRGWVKVTDIFDGIEVLGKRRKGKPQLTEDESRTFLSVALTLGKSGDRGAIAAACALLLGMRASEIADRIVRDLDASGTKLRITEAKTQAGIRTIRIPLILQPLLKELAMGKQSSERLFGEVNRHWVLRSTRRLCQTAGVPVVPAHGLRGTHARLAVEAGISGEIVAASLGHESFATTTSHYSGADAVSGARVARVVEVLR
jgi:integrase